MLQRGCLPQKIWHVKIVNITGPNALKRQEYGIQLLNLTGKPPNTSVGNLNCTAWCWVHHRLEQPCRQPNPQVHRAQHQCSQPSDIQCFKTHKIRNIVACYIYNKVNVNKYDGFNSTYITASITVTNDDSLKHSLCVRNRGADSSVNL